MRAKHGSDTNGREEVHTVTSNLQEQVCERLPQIGRFRGGFHGILRGEFLAGRPKILKMQAGVSSLVETFVGFSANETAEQGAVIAQLVLGEHRLYEASPERARFADRAVAAIECNGVGLLQLVKEMGGILTGDDARRR